MRYDDASNTGSMAAADSAPTARPDVEFLPQGDMGPATGNAITGAGTTSGASGADQVGDAPARIVEVSGPSGPAAASGTGFQANGQYGVLNMDAQGNFSYSRNGGTPDGVQDVFGYTLADADGTTSSTTLTVNIGRDLTTEALGAAQGVVNLPPGVELSDIRVVGRDLVINMPDGTQMVIPGGAVFVPQLVIGDVEVPATNLAALLVSSEPQPAAGLVPSSGGNFAAPVPPLDPGVPLGDLLPPTELSFTPPEFEELFDVLDDEPEITITPDGQPAAVNAVDSVDEAGLPTRTGEPEGSGEEAAAGDNGDPREATSGVINIDAQDGIDSVTINGEEVTDVGQVIEGEQGTLTITSINLATGQIGYTYLLTDNTDPGGDGISDLFSVTVTDEDGDTATATLTINIIDDEPIARDDTDAVTLQDPTTEGNVLTGVDTTSGAAGRDTEGADGLNGQTNDSIDGVTGIRAGTTGSFTAVPQSGANVVINGQFGTLTINNDGSYTYAHTVETETGGVDVFTYEITDGDGDVDTATLTITIPANPDDEPEILRVEDTLVDEDGLEGANVDGVPLRPGETDSTESATDSGQILVDFFGDVPANLMAAITLVDSPALDGQLQTTDGQNIVFALEGGQLVGRPQGGGDPLVIISITGAVAGTGGQVTYTYQVQLLGPVEHPDPGSEDTIQLTGVDFQVTDSNGDTASGEFDVTIVDDLPIAVEPPENPQDPEGPPIPIISGAVDEDDLVPNGNSDVIDGSDDLADPSPTTVGGGAGDLNALFNAGADSPMQNFGLVDDTSGLPALTSNGRPVQYDIDVAAGTLTAVADIDGDGTVESNETIFVLTVNPNGSWSFQLLGQLDHPEAGTEDNLLLDLSSVITAEDADGDPAVAADGAFVINVDDDMPRPFDDPDIEGDPVCPDDTVATNQPGTSVLDIPLNLPPVGADQPGKLTFDITNGEPVMDNGDPPQPILSNGQPLFYFINESDPTILEARTSEGADPVFIIDLDPVSGTYDFHLLGDITSEVSVHIDNLESIGGGNVDAKAIDVPDTPFDLILSTQPENTINTSQNFIGAATGQSLEDGDVVRVDFVQNAFTTGSGGGAVLNFGEYYAATSYRQDVGGLNPAQTADFTVRAILVVESGNPTDPADGDNVFFGDANDTVLGETSLNIYDDNGVLVDPADYGSLGIVVTDNGDGSWSIENLPQSFDFEILSDTAFNAVEIEALPGSDTFKLGVIDMTRVEPTPVDFTVPIVLTDADGDPVTCDIDVILTPGVTTGADTATVDDDGLDGANPLGGADIDANDGDENAGEPGDTEAVFVGTLSSGGGGGSATFSLVAPTDPLTIGQETVEITGTGTLLTATITNSPDSGREGEDLFTVSLDPDTGEYTITLLINVLHEDTGLNNENGTDLSVGIGFEVTDGVTTSEGAINIVFNDDVPSATDHEVTQSGEDANVTIDITVGLVEGADGVDLNDVTWTDPGTPGALTFDATTGVFTYNPVDGETGDVTFDYTIVDADGDEVTETVLIHLAADSTPRIGTPQNVIVDEDGLTLIANADNGQIAPDPVEVDANEDASVTGQVIVNYGDDVPSDLGAAFEFINPDSLDGQLTTLDGVAVDFELEGDNLVGRPTGGGDALVIISLATAVAGPGVGEVTYTYQVDLLQPVQHADVGNNENTELLDNVQFQVTDSDNDPATGSFDVTIYDDVPGLNASSDATADLVVPLKWNGTFDFDIGADTNAPYSLTSHDIEVALSGTLGSGALEQTIQNVSVEIVSASATSEAFDFEFDYDPNPTDADDTPTETATGTITFNKTDGTYSIVLDQPIATFNTINTGNTLSKTSYNTVGPSEAQPEIVVSKLANDFFIRFTGAEDDLVSPPTNGGWVAGEEFTGTQGWVSISGTENGVSSDTLQNSEVLDMDFFTTDPGAVGTATAAVADNVYIKLAQFNSAQEDFVVILKLVSQSDPTDVTTRAVVVDSGDVWLASETNPYGITFATGEDGVVIIESNDYNFGTDDYQIIGMQLMTSTDGITSAANAAIDLDRDTADPETGIGGESAMTDELDAATTDQDVIKIVDIGFIRVTTNTQDIHLDFDVTVTDADGDSFSQQLSINPVADALTTFASTSDLADSSFESLSLLSANDNVEQQRTSNNTMIMSAALAAAGLATEPLAASTEDHRGRRGGEDQGRTADDTSSPTVEGRSEDQSKVSNALDQSVAADEAKPAENANSNEEAAAEDKGVSNENAPPPAVSELSQGTDAPTQSEAQTSQPVMADAVAMISAEQLEAASKDGGKSVEGKDAKPDVGKVLADALNGGENGKDLDALINAVSGQDNAHDGLASHGGNAVSNGDMSVFAGLAAAHTDDIMTQLTMHQDAAPAQA